MNMTSAVNSPAPLADEKCSFIYICWQHWMDLEKKFSASV